MHIIDANSSTTIEEFIKRVKSKMIELDIDNNLTSIDCQFLPNTDNMLDMDPTKTLNEILDLSTKVDGEKVVFEVNIDTSGGRRKSRKSRKSRRR